MCVHALRESAQWNKEEMLLFSIALRTWSAALTGKLHQRRDAEVGLFFLLTAFANTNNTFKYIHTKTNT